MMPTSDIWIWKSETGITDLDATEIALAQASVNQIRNDWSALRESSDESKLSEQLHREWAIETGLIENLYDIDRGVTQTLIEEGFQKAALVHGSVNKDPDYVFNLLNDQRLALDSLFAFVKKEQPLTKHYIKELHQLMTNSQESTEAVGPDGELVNVPLLKGDWKKLPNHPVRDGVRFNYCPPEQVDSEMERLIDLHNQHLDANVPSEVEAAWLHHRFSQIHPFMDGNGRMARSLASLVLIRGGLFPLVIPRDDKVAYIKCLEFADEGNLTPLIKTIARRQEAAMWRIRSISQRINLETANLLDAVTFLGLRYKESKSQIFKRINARYQALQLQLNSLLQNFEYALGREFRQAAELEDDNIRIFDHDITNLSDSTFEFVTDQILRKSGNRIAPHYLAYFISFKLHKTNFLIIAYPPKPDFSACIEIEACSFNASPLEFKTESWKWHDDEIDLEKTTLSVWLSEIFREAIEALARRP